MCVRVYLEDSVCVDKHTGGTVAPIEGSLPLDAENRIDDNVASVADIEHSKVGEKINISGVVCEVQDLHSYYYADKVLNTIQRIQHTSSCN